MLYILPAAIVYLGGLAAYFAYMYVLQIHFDDEDKLPKFSFLGKLIGPIICVFLNLFKS